MAMSIGGKRKFREIDCFSEASRRSKARRVRTNSNRTLTCLGVLVVPFLCFPSSASPQDHEWLSFVEKALGCLSDRDFFELRGLFRLDDGLDTSVLVRQLQNLQGENAELLKDALAELGYVLDERWKQEDFCLQSGSACHVGRIGWEDVVPAWLSSHVASGVADTMVTVPAVPARHNMKSLMNEDWYMWENFFFQQGNGTFFEMGALDGIQHSNTYALEKDLGWKGLLVEGSPVNFEKLKSNRPDQLLVQAAVCREREIVHYVSGGTGNVQGIWEFMTPEFQAKFHPNKHMGDNYTQEVLCVPLTDIFSRFAIPHFNLFVVDVEGAEFEVLQSMDWDLVSIDVLVVEAHNTSPHKNALVFELIYETDLFDFHGRVAENDWWISKTFDPIFKTAAPIRQKLE